MIAALLTKEVLQILLPALGILGVVFGIYIKGRGDGKRSVERDIQEAQQKKQEAVDSAQKEVQKLEGQRRDNNEEISSAASTSLSALIRLFNKKYGKSDKRD